MKRLIRFRETVSGLAARALLLDEQAPESCGFLWELANSRGSFDAIHAMWTGPELSCPLPADVLPGHMTGKVIPFENSTSFPKSGDIVLAYAEAGSIRGLPPGAFFDLGIFYDGGGRLLMPFGWIRANVCAQILEEDMTEARNCLQTIRRNGACRLSIEPI